MLTQTLFVIVFLSQILLISAYLPWRLLSRTRYVVDTYPPSEYPRLYRAPGGIEKSMRVYRAMNGVALLSGLVLLVAGLLGPGWALFDWNGGTVVALYFFVQLVPLSMTLSTSFPYFGIWRQLDERPTRTAEIRRRRLFDFVSPTLVGVAGATYLAFVALIVYVRQFDFAWFGGYWNLVGVTAMNALFAGLIFRQLYGKPGDPYQAREDRARTIARSATILVFASIVATTFIGLNIGLHAFDLDHLDPVALSLYLQVVAAISFRSFRVDDANFDVYREDQLATTPC